MTTAAIRPMLAAAATIPEVWPAEGFWVQPKFDGLRCLIDPVSGPVTRSGQPIPNTTVRNMLSDPALIGLDGELTAVGGLEAAQSAFMGDGTPPEWRFTAFDDLKAFSAPFSARMASLRRRADALPAFALVSPAVLARSADELSTAFSDVIDAHHQQDRMTALDGFCLRAASRPYHEGKSNPVRGELIKIKPMAEAEGCVVDIAARTDDPADLGALQVRLGDQTLWTPVGMARDHRKAWMLDSDRLIGSAATIRWWGTTARGLPRHAVAVAIRRNPDA